MDTDSATAPAIISKGLVKQFGDFTAVNGVDFDVHFGEIFGFLGPNGSGKTTTIRMMLGLLQPSAGSVELLGIPVKGLTRDLRLRIGYMSQKFSLYNDLTVRQNLEFYGAAYGLADQRLQKRISEILELADLVGREDIHTKDLSGGWRQRLALGAAIIHRPEVIFLDEPTAGVDPVSRRAFWDLLYQLVQEKVAVFVTTHYMDEAEHCHRLAFIQRGQIIALGTPAEIKRRHMPGQVLEIEPTDAVSAVRVLRQVRDKGELPYLNIELYGAVIHVLGEGLKDVQYEIASVLEQAGISYGSMALIEPTLEDVFIASLQD
jgi:ABC-2 type transport system ATP-binding protein